jgi:hypothetical protein
MNTQILSLFQQGGPVASSGPGVPQNILSAPVGPHGHVGNGDKGMQQMVSTVLIVNSTTS